MAQTFKEFMATKRVTDTPRGDFIKDSRDDPRMPAAQSWQELEGYLWTRGACVEAVKQAKKLWRQYEKELTSQNCKSI
jgi:hypothetical protein